MLIEFDFSSKTGILVVKFAFATANLKIDLAHAQTFCTRVPLTRCCFFDWIAGSCLSINQSINHLFSNAGLQSGSHKADVDLQRTNEI